MHSVKDEYITGNICRTRKSCDNCGHPTTCISIHTIAWPEFIKNPDSRLIFYNVEHIGIGCGCYAKGHRQIAHIASRVADGKS